MKKISCIIAFAAALVFVGSQIACSQPCPTGQPCPAAKPCPVSTPCQPPCAVAKPCPASTPCQSPCPCQKPCPTSQPCASPCPVDKTPCPCKNPVSSNLTIPDTLCAQPCFKTFSSLLQHSGLDKTLKCQGPYTVFAPTDEAFCKLPKGTVDKLMCPENKCKLERILKYHIVNEAIPCAKLTCTTKYTTAEGKSLTISQKEQKLYVNNAEIIKGDICAQNGQIYIIDKVLFPKWSDRHAHKCLNKCSPCGK